MEKEKISINGKNFILDTEDKIIGLVVESTKEYKIIIN